MKLPLSWLSEYVKIDIPIKKYCDDMTMSGSKVETCEYLGREISNVVVGRIESIKKHPAADRLVVCEVFCGDSTTEIVTGAKNLKVNDLVPAALDGAVLPGGKRIYKSDMRGVASNGMLCSFSELGLTLNDVPYADPDGILVLSEGDVLPGQDIKKVLGFDENVVDFEITSNRPDCLSIIGLARESAAVFKSSISLKEPKIKKLSGNIKDILEIKIDDPDLCKRYSARAVKNIKIGSSPKWLRERLRACGVRPINNIVDITNYVMLEYGQPMHAFDYSCVEGGRITVRRAKDKEVFITLDSKERVLDQNMLVIADQNNPIGIAGVMGGQNSEITGSTKIIVFESAAFNGPSVRMTAKKLGLRTEASARFEKGLDPENTLPALERACELCEMLDAGEVMEGVIDIDYSDKNKRRVTVDADAINRLLGTDIKKEEMVKILESLSFVYNYENGTVEVPTWRQDVILMADLAEEVARIYGYDNIPSTIFSGKADKGLLSPAQRFERKVKEACRFTGFDEIMTYSFISPKFYDRIELPKDSALRRSLVITNPLGDEQSIMRTTALPSMLEIITKNFNRRNPSACLFELATIYLPSLKDGKTDQTKLPCEKMKLVLSSYGNNMDFYTFKGLVETILDCLSTRKVTFGTQTENPSYHPGRCAEVLSSGKKIGVLGEIHPKVLENYGINETVYAAELDFSMLLDAAEKEKKYSPLPRFPAITRDIAIICNDSTEAQDIDIIIRETLGDLLESASLFDVYKGSQITEGKKSVAYTITMRASDRTLKDEEADSAVKKVLSALNEKLGAVLRM